MGRWRAKPGQVMTVAIAWLALGAAAGAAGASEPMQGTLQTYDDRHAGELHFADDAVGVDDATWPWDRLLTLVVEPAASARPGPHVVHLVGGERWPGRVVSYDGEMLTVDVPALGERTLPAAALQAIDFTPDAGELPWPPERYGVLIRTAGGPVPATLTRFDDATLTVDSRLGEIELQRDLARRYVFDEPEADAEAGAAPEQDTLTLQGGVVLHGVVRPATAAVTLEHAWLGEVEVAWQQVQSLRRRPADVVYLGELTPTHQQGEPLLVDVLPAEVFARRIEGAGALDAWALQPRLKQVYELPDDAATHDRRLRMRVTPLAGARGAVVLRVLADEAEAWQATIQPDDEPQTVAVALASARGVTIEVDYGEPLAFPLGVVLSEALVFGASGEDE